MTSTSERTTTAAAVGDREFDLLGDLPAGTTILEASAGTGKTYTIAGLVTRYVVERGVPLPALLVVTFTRAATAELRDRVRARLVAAADHLAAVLAGAPATHRDDVLQHLAAGATPDELRERHARAATAVADFDAATIATIHGFCQQVLRTLGLAVDADPDADLIADQRDLVTAVVDDLLVRDATASGRAAVKRSHLLEIAQLVVNNPDAAIVPDGSERLDLDGDADVDQAAVVADLAGRIRAELAARKRARRVLSYDDLLTQLRDALADPAQGDRAAAALRRRYQVALIDEFQDTDPVQWDILHRAFRADGSTLVLIGDPKQAIYSFRGADVYAYLAARGVSDDRSTLATNWRSDGPLLAALDTLLADATFGDPRIAYRTVAPAPKHEHARISGDRPPLRLRRVPRSHELRGSSGDIVSSVARDHIAADLAAEAVRLLDAGLTITGDDGRDRRVGAGDLAVLVRTNAEAVQVHRALREVAVPAIINGVGSVFETPAATEWLRLLEALEQPANGSRARAATLTSFLGWTGEQLAAAGEDDLGQVHELLHGWAAVLRDRGVASLLRTIAADRELPRRLLGVAGGERHLTDLEHLGQLLHRAAVEDQLGPAALTSWLTIAIAETSEDQVPADEQARRLESDDRAVQILTVHRSKGLQYPIVFAPYLWSPGRTWVGVPTFHAGGRRAIDVGGKRDGDPVWEDHRERALEEHFGEQLRLLYVALTRAEHQVVVWFAPCRDANKSGLGRVLFARDVDGRLDTSRAGGVPSDGRCEERLGALAGRSGGTFVVEETDRRPSKAVWMPPTGDVPAMRAAQLGRDLDRHWHRTSYSRITALAHGAPTVASEPDETVKDDEALDVVDSPEVDGGPQPAAPTFDDAQLRATPLPLGDAPGGPEFGTFVHAVLEHTDFTADDLRVHLGQVIADQHAARRTPIGDPDVLADGLARAVETPLGPLTGGQPLRAFAGSHRLDEPEFELPLDPRVTGRVTVRRIGELLTEHVRAPDPLAGYGAALAADGLDGDLRGFLTGFIDLVLRVPGDGADRYVVADHKTNRLGSWGTPLTAWDYRPDALPDAMIRGHYPLQALIYQVALHRYLRWRLHGYDPTVHLGGALYLFLRGMAGPDAPTVAGHPCGVFTWQPPSELIVAVSDLLDGGVS